MKRRFYVVRLKKLLLYGGVLLLILLLVLQSEQAIGAVQNALLLCGRTVIPSLFPFFVLSGILSGGGFVRLLARRLSPVMQPLFRVNGAGALPFVIGMLSGYPGGAKMTAALYTDGAISQQEAERLLPFTNNAGPLFIIGAVGTGMLGEPKLGIYLYGIHVSCALLVGLCFRFHRSMDAPAADRRTTQPMAAGGSLLASAVTDSIHTMLSVCGYILFFAAMTACLTPLADALLPPALALALKALTEVTAGTQLFIQQGLPLRITLSCLAGVIGFGGLCVMMQVGGILSDAGLSLKTYVPGKLLQGLLAAVCTYCSFPFIAPSALPAAAPAATFPASRPSAIRLLLAATLFCILLYGILKKINTKSSGTC